MTVLPSIPLLRAGGRLREIPVAAIRVAPRNPRSDAESTIDGLAASLSAGLVQFPLVVPVSDDEYELVDGERRWRASQAAGLDTLTCLVRDPGTPSATLFTQILANLHRQELGPLDESAALKAAWLVLNAQAMGLGERADAILGDAGQLRDALEPLRALLEGAGWSWREPPVSQSVFVDQLGLGMSAAVLKKKLQLLGATDEIQVAARRHQLTAAAIRALMTLAPDDQATLLAAVEANPELARQVRTIVQGVRQKGRSIGDAIAIAQGRLPGDELAPVAASPTGISIPVTDDQEEGADAGSGPATARGAPSAGGDGLPDAAPDIDEMAVMDAVLPLIDLAQQVKRQIAALLALTRGDASRIPAPWGEYADEAIGLITTSIGTFQPAS